MKTRLHILLVLLLGMLVIGGTVTRGAKTGGGTDFNDGQVIEAAEFNTDFNTLFTLVNGNLDADNLAANSVDTSELAAGAVTNTEVDASAAIAPSKLDQTAGAADGTAGIDADIVQSYAGSDAEYNTRTDPLDSAATPSIPAHLEEELERIRYVLARYGIGIPTKVTDGTASAAWYDGLAVGPNLLKNGSFLGKDTISAVGADVPFGWTSTGATATLAWTALPVTEGYGSSIGISDSTPGATTDGFAQTLNGLRAQTLYLVTARVLPTTANVTLSTTGATGTFGNLDLDSGASGDGHVASATDWQTLAGLIETDATPAPIVVKLNPDATTYDFDVSHVSVREVIGSRDAEGTGREHREPRGGSRIWHKTSTSSTLATIRSNTTVEFFVPGDNYQVLVSGVMANVADTSSLIIEENTDVDGIGSYSTAFTITAGGGDPVPLLYGRESLTPGTTYGYRLAFSGGTVSTKHGITVNLVRMD